MFLIELKLISNTRRILLNKSIWIAVLSVSNGSKIKVERCVDVIVTDASVHCKRPPYRWICTTRCELLSPISVMSCSEGNGYKLQSVKGFYCLVI